MPTFDYKARQRNGKISTGHIDAADRRQASARLGEQGLSPLTLRESQTHSGSSLSGMWHRITKLVSPTPSVLSSEELSTPKAKGGSPKHENIGLVLLKRILELHSSGLPVADAIQILSQRLSDKEQKTLASRLWKDLSEGSTFANALTCHPRYFSVSISYVIEAGEATGHLTPILKKVVEHLEEKQEIRKKLIASMIYPSIICTVALGVVILFLVYLLPKIQDMMEKLGGELTLSARILIDGSDLIVQFGPFILIALIIAGLTLSQWRKTKNGRRKSDTWILKVPMLGKIFYLSDLFQAGNLISTLLESGINTTETLQLTERALKNTELRERFHTARTQVNEGLSVAQAFKRNTFMPDLAIDILTVGENTGNLAHSMNEVTRSFRNELTNYLSRLTTIVSSGALVCAFILVALIAIGIVTSIFGASQSLSG